MNKKQKNELTDTVINNNEYFFRDSEMYRADLENPKHEIDPSINGRNKNKVKKRG